MKVISALMVGSLCLVASSLSTSVQADDQMAASMCDYVKADDKNRLRKLLSDNRLRLRNVYDGIMCNGQNMIQFAIANNANNAGEFIIKQLPAAHISASGDIAWAESNHAGSALIAMLKERAGGGD
jgi:hypothetical protein